MIIMNYNTTTGIFPFEFISMKHDKCPFIQNVESILTTNLQSKDSFGCKIKKCHTHAGSKVHFEDFIEAELLFHNNYYNHGFAFLTVEKIISEISTKSEIKRVVLIGYESYSELYLQEVQTLIKEYNKNIVCDYCVYETVAKIQNGERITFPRIRNLFVTNDDIFIKYGYSISDDNPIFIENTLFVFIVPINTTLSTMDKMISLFKKETNNQYILTKLLCLITIGNDNQYNHYWEIDNNEPKPIIYLKPKKHRFVELKDNDTIPTFAYVQSNWSYTKSFNNETDEKEFNICKSCYPDVECNDKFKSNSLLCEKPIFDVTRGSVVPMLQLGTTEYLKPSKPFKGNIKDFDNLRRVWEISSNMAYKHIVRGDNHFQFYFDATGYLNKHHKEVKNYLINISKDFETSSDNLVVYNYIVAPRQESNSRWVNLVYSSIFANKEYIINPEYCGARILYFDVTQEYRSNFKAKYSDFFRSIDNIANSGQKFEIRFHYVDETIGSGDTFLRAADLIHSLISNIKLKSNNIKDSNIVLFHSIFLLYGRSSYDSKDFYNSLFKRICLFDQQNEKSLNKFYEYAHISISQMRNYEDACILCKLVNDYHRIQKFCGTNELADICYDFIEKHNLCQMPIQKNNNMLCTNEDGFHCSMEKRFLFFITHILNNRLCKNNGPLFLKLNKKGKPLMRCTEKVILPIDIESEDAAQNILDVLDDYYSNLFMRLIDQNVFNLSEEFKKEFDQCKKCLNNDCTKCSYFKYAKKVFQFKYNQDFENAFIKAISRPFFTFHLRKRQAAFAFCLKKLNGLLNDDKNIEHDDEIKSLRLMRSLVKALSDMNANYLIRSTDEYSPFEMLLYWAEKGDDITQKENVKIFDTKCFRSYIKKMMSLTQDTTKSLLLEHILINKNESGFFDNNNYIQNGAINEFLKDMEVTTKGLIYLENNRIIKDALNDVVRNNNTAEQLPYYLDNFKSICNINSYDIGNVIDDFSNQYKSLQNHLTGKIKNFNLDLKINEWIKTIADGMSVNAFVHNSTNKNDPNHFFEFFLLSDDTSENERQIFYDDNHIQKLLDQLIHGNSKNQDIVFFNNIVWIKYRANKNRSDCIYLEIKNFNPNNILCWFTLKMLLTLRSDFANYIEQINLPVVIKAKAEEMRKKALRLNKSVTHSAAETFMCPDIYMNNINEPWESYVVNILKKQKFQVPYDKYFQVIANEMVSHIYRKIVRCDNDILYNINSQKNKRPVSEIQNIFKNTFVKDKNNEYIINCFHDNAEIRTVNLKFNFLPEEHAEKLYVSDFSVFNGEIEPLVLLTLIMVMNVAEHGTIDYLQIDFEKGGIKFRNSYSNQINEKEIEKYTTIPPWHFSTSHITLWSLKHFLNDKFDYEISPSENTFTTCFNIFTDTGNAIS